MRACPIVLGEPLIQISVCKPLQAGLELLTKCRGIELFLNGAMETLADAIGLWVRVRGWCSFCQLVFLHLPAQSTDQVVGRTAKLALKHLSEDLDGFGFGPTEPCVRLLFCFDSFSNAIYPLHPGVSINSPCSPRGLACAYARFRTRQKPPLHLTPCRCPFRACIPHSCGARSRQFSQRPRSAGVLWFFSVV